MDNHAYTSADQTTMEMTEKNAPMPTYRQQQPFDHNVDTPANPNPVPSPDAPSNLYPVLSQIQPVYQDPGNPSSPAVTSSSAKTDHRRLEIPMVLTLKESKLDRLTQRMCRGVTVFLSWVTAVLSWPFILFAMLLHNAFRCFFVSALKPVLVDGLVLVRVYVIDPLVYLVLLPLLKAVLAIVEAVSDILMSIGRPTRALLKSFRLVEITYTGKYPDPHAAPSNSV